MIITKEETSQFITGLKSTKEIKLEWMAELCPVISKKIKMRISLIEIYNALIEKQLIDNNYSFSSFKKDYYEVKNSTNNKQKPNGKRSEIEKLTQQLKESQEQTKHFYEELQKAEEKLAKINELSEEEKDI